MKKLIFTAATAALTLACAPKITVTVENTLGFDRSAELVEIPTADLGASTLADGQTWVVTDDTGEVIPSQVTSEGLLIFQSGLGANQTANFTVTAGEPREFAPKTKGRLAPERFDDMIWENDRVAFRIYGAALMAKDGPSNGIDALYKRSTDMVIDSWYEGDLKQGKSYHDDHGTGLDNYDVKRSLGAGAAAPFTGGTLWLNTNFTGHEVLDNGPLRTTFRLTYPDIVIDGTPASETRTISLDAGSQLTRVVQEYGVDKPMTVAVGFPLRGADQPFSCKDGVLAFEEPATAKASGVHPGAVVPGADGASVHSYEIPAGEKAAGIYRHVLVTAPYTPGTPFIYYTGYAWERHGNWTAEKWAAYLNDFAVTRKTPFVITIK